MAERKDQSNMGGSTLQPSTASPEIYSNRGARLYVFDGAKCMVNNSAANSKNGRIHPLHYVHSKRT